MTNVQKLPLLTMMAIIAVAVIIGITDSTEAQHDANGVDSQMTYGSGLTYGGNVLSQLQRQLAGVDPLVQQQIWQQIPNLFPTQNLQSTFGVVDQFGNFRPPVADYNTGLEYINASQGLLDRLGGLNPDVANFLTGQNYITGSDGLLDAFGVLNPNVADFRTGLQQIESSQGVLDRLGNLVPGTFHLGQLNAINNPYALAWSWTNPFDPGDYTPPPQRPQYQPNQMQRTFTPQRPQAQPQTRPQPRQRNPYGSTSMLPPPDQALRDTYGTPRTPAVRTPGRERDAVRSYLQSRDPNKRGTPNVYVPRPNAPTYSTPKDAPRVTVTPNAARDRLRALGF